MKVLKPSFSLHRIAVFLCILISGHAAIGQSSLQGVDLNALLDSAQVYINGFHHDKGDSLIRLVAEQLQPTTPKEIRAKYHHMQAQAFLNVWALQKAEDEFLKSIALNTALQDSNQLVTVYSGLGTTLCEQNRYHEGALYQRKALTYFIDQDSATYYGLMSNLAVSYNMARENDRALALLVEVKKYFERQKMYDRLAVVENNIGEFYRDGLRNIPTAMRHYHRAVKLNILSNQDNYLVQNYHNLSLAHRAVEQYDSAFYYLKKSFSLRQRLSGEGGMAITYHSLGQLYAETGRLDSAAWAFNETLRISEERGIAPGVFYGSLGMGKVYEDRHQLKEALEAYGKGLQIANEIGSLPMQEEAHNYLYQFHKENKQHELALAQYEQLNVIRDSISQMQNDSRVAELKTRYEMDRSEAENEMLKAQQEAQLLEIERQYWVLIGLSVVLVLIVVAAVLLAWVNRQRKRAFDQAETSRKELELQYQKVKEQEEKLKEANALKNRIFSVLGHDLRSPLINISSMLHLISAKEITSSELENLLGHLQTETDLSIHTLHNILQWSRMQMNDQATNRTHISVRNVIRDLQQIFESTARLKSVTLHFNDDCKDELWVDENQFKSIATNLISNALKFTPKGSSVIVAFEADARDVCFSVSDRGNGFDPAMIRLFEEGEKPTSLLGTAGEKGTGIGLQIVRDFVAAHNGRITLMNNEHGGGYVEIRFPKMVQGQKEPSRGEVASV